MNHAGDPAHDDTAPRWFFSRGTLVACIALTTVGILLLTGHKAHLLGVAPYLLLLACPLMHLFMHGGHGSHRSPSAPHQSHGDCEATESQPADVPK